jgi:hypothetical protein
VRGGARHAAGFAHGTKPSADGINAWRGAFKPNGQLANLIISVAKVVTRF